MGNKDDRRIKTREFIKNSINNKSYDASSDLKEIIKLTKDVRLQAAMDRTTI